MSKSYTDTLLGRYVSRTDTINVFEQVIESPFVHVHVHASLTLYVEYRIQARYAASVPPAGGRRDAR